MVSISIIIPIYNVEVYIRRCLESVMTQEFVGATIECILIDDCTPDRSMEIAKEMVDDYGGPISFVLLRHEEIVACQQLEIQAFSMLRGIMFSLWIPMIISCQIVFSISWIIRLNIKMWIF